MGGPFTATPMLSYGAVKIKLSNEIRIMFLGDRDGCLKLSFIQCLLASIKLDFYYISFILFYDARFRKFVNGPLVVSSFDDLSRRAKFVFPIFVQNLK